MVLVISPKNVYITGRLKQEFARSGTPAVFLSMQELAQRDFKVNVNSYKVLYVRSPFVDSSPRYFPQIIALAAQFRAAGKRVIDAVIADGKLGEGKRADYDTLAAADILIPKATDLSGRTNLSLPYIAKWQYGFGGQGTFLIKRPADLQKIPARIPPEELILQEFIPAEFEYKVVTVGYKSLPVILRFAINKKTWRPDFTKLAVLQAADAALVAGLAEASSRILNRELSKVDILESQGKFYVLEVNRWPGLSSFEKLTGYNAVGEFVKYLLKD